MQTPATKSFLAAYFVSFCAMGPMMLIVGLLVGIAAGALLSFILPGDLWFFSIFLTWLGFLTIPAYFSAKDSIKD